MVNRYYSEFDFYRKLLDIISNDTSDSRKVRAIKCAIYQQFENYTKLLNSRDKKVFNKIKSSDYD